MILKITKKTAFLLIIGLISCNQKLSDEDRSAFKEEMIQRTIVKVTSEELYGLVEETMESIRENAAKGIPTERTDLLQMDTIYSGDQLDESMKMMLEAYQYSLEKGEQLNENLQELATGDILVTIPITEDTLATTRLKSMVNIHFNRAELIREIARGKSKED